MSEQLRQQQAAFAAYLRDPEHQPAPQGIPTRRLQVYQELYFNNLANLLASNFPVILRILGPVRWRELVQTFCREHRAHTPLFTELGQEFIAFLGNSAQRQLPDWLPELAHYEWVELALQIADDPLPPHVADGDVLSGIPVLSPYIASLTYRWPVHRISPEFLPPQAPAEATRLLARRDSHGQVRFAEISPSAMYLLALLDQTEDHSGEELIAMLAEQTAMPDQRELMQHGRDLLLRLHDQGTILGTKP